MKLHHCANKVTMGSLEFAVELFEHMGLTLYAKPDGMRFAIIGRKGMLLQLIEMPHKPLDLEHKRECHIAFISNGPKEDIEKIKKFVESKGKEIIINSWSEKEFYFDIPDIFINFVIEIMDNSVDPE